MSDSILFWNAVALEADRIAHTDPDKREQNGPTLSSRAMAIVHLAMYDAFAATTDPTLPTYAPLPVPVPINPSAPDAVAGAAHATLSALYTRQREFFDAHLSCFNPDTPSFDFGREVGLNLIQLRENDMDGRDCGYIPSPKRGRHRVDPDNPGQGFYSPFYGAQTPGFAITVRHGLKPPPFDNGEHTDYLRALRHVRARGIRPDLIATLPDSLFDNRRTGRETLKGIYWGYDGAVRLGTPPRLYNQIVRKVAINRGNIERDNARLFAFVNAALGDAGILAWQHKYCFDFWRPVVGIREHDENLGPLAPHAGVSVNFNDGDPGWLPLGAPSTNSIGMKNFTPNFPAYPSGHATFGAAALHITRMFYGVDPEDKSEDDLFPEFFESDEFNGRNRDNDGTVRPRHTRFFNEGLWGMIIENALSRIFLGVHWIFDAFDFKKRGDELVPDLDDEEIGGVGLGLRIARDIFSAGGGIAPKMTPSGQAEPPIETPPPKSPMPAIPTQPAEVEGCAGPAMPAGIQAARPGTVQDVYPPQTPRAGITGSAGENMIQGAWPSGISEK